jgi:hypothetical protein
MRIAALRLPYRRRDGHRRDKAPEAAETPNAWLIPLDGRRRLRRVQQAGQALAQVVSRAVEAGLDRLGGATHYGADFGVR